MYFSHICHFRPMTQPNPQKTQIFDPFPTNPTQPNPTRGSTQPMDNSDRSCLWVCDSGRAVSEPYYSQRARSVCVSLSTFFIL